MSASAADRSLSNRLYWHYRRLVERLSRPIAHRHLMDPRVGGEHGITNAQKRRLLRAIHRNVSSITSATGWEEHVLLAARVLSLPKSLPGDVVECGCFKGSSTTTLSLACSMVGRRLIVCDSFEGLPTPTAGDEVHVSLQFGRFERYSKGEYQGALEEVRSNVTRLGEPRVCTFVKGYFDQTLSSLRGPFSMIFLDVDLHESLRTCLEQLWPKLSEGGFLYTHEAQQLDYVGRFFNDAWWQNVHGQAAPGLIGAGTGLSCGLSEGSGLGYTVKLTDRAAQVEAMKLRLFQGDPSTAKAA